MLLASVTLINPVSVNLGATAEQIVAMAVTNDTSSSMSTTTTPIKHLIVIYQENVAFDTYFATYPIAQNLPGEPHFSASPDTPSINGLTVSLLNNNTNLVDPFRFDREDAKIVAVCGNAHTYTHIQKTYNSGLLDKFVGDVYNTTSKNCSQNQPMGFFDGNTVTALWNYAQHFAMSDNFHSTIFGPSLPGHIHLISGQTHGAIPENIPDMVSNGTLIGDIDSTFDDCSEGQTISFTGENIGNLLNENGVTWGWFQGGFKPTSRIAVESDNSNSQTVATNTAAVGRAVCESAHLNIAGENITDYVVHHEPFQYYESTSNPHHLPPTSVEMIGRTDQANHQYDLSDFWNAAENGSLPAVSFLKASHYQDGHPGNSDPLDEQTFIVNTMNRLQELPEWNETAIIITYDDSGGWYDHVMPPIISQSNDPIYDALLGPDGLCGRAPSDAYQDRCGYGGRLPMIAVSPWAKINYVDHQLTDQTSILRFIEDNWELGRIGDQSFDERAGSILGMFNFTGSHYAERLFLNPDNGTTDMTSVHDVEEGPKE
jgi:phospholipase C